MFVIFDKFEFLSAARELQYTTFSKNSQNRALNSQNLLTALSAHLFLESLLCPPQTCCSIVRHDFWILGFGDTRTETRSTSKTGPLENRNDTRRSINTTLKHSATSASNWNVNQRFSILITSNHKWSDLHISQDLFDLEVVQDVFGIKKDFKKCSTRMVSNKVVELNPIK